MRLCSFHFSCGLRAALLAGTALGVLGGAFSALAQDGVIDLETVNVQTSGADGSGTATEGGEGTEAGASAGEYRTRGYVATTVPTATKTDTPLVRVPQSVSVVTERQLEDRNVQTLTEAIAYTPGVRVGSFGFDPRFDSFFIRGLDATYTGIFRDGLREFNFGFATFDIEPYGLAGISILKGPAAGLYGSSNAGGIVDLRSKRPTREAFREIEGQIGTNNRYQANVDASGPLGNSTSAFYRLTGVARAADTDYPFADDDRLSIAPAFTYAPDADTSLTILGELQRSKNGTTVAYYNADNRVSNPPAGDPDFNDLDQRQGRIGLEFEQRLNDSFVFRQKARYQAIDDVKGEYTFLLGAPVNDVIGRGTGIVRQTLEGVVSDSQVEAKFETGPLAHTVIGGVDVSYAEFTDKQGFGAAPPISFSDPVYGTAIVRPDYSTAQTQDQTQVGLYLQDEVRIDRLSLTFGGRKDFVDTNTRNGTPNDLGDEDTQKDDAFSGRVGASYLFDFGVAPYVSYSTTFSPVIGTTQDGEAFVPTKARQWEGGVKVQIPNMDAFLTAAVFDILQKNGVVLIPQGSTNISVQRGEVRSRGFELEGTASLMDGLNATASYAYAEVTNEDGTPDLVGKDVSSRPRHTFSIWGDYTIQDGVAQGLGFGAGVRYLSSSFGDDANTFKNDARAFVDAAIHYEVPQVEGLRVQVNATNLFDEDSQVCTSGFCYKEQERSVIGSVRYRF